MPALQTGVFIGSREVVASGEFLLSPSEPEPEARVTLEDLTYSFRFIAGAGHPRLSFEQDGPQGLRLVIVGEIPLGGAAWDAGQVGTLHGKPLRLTTAVSLYGLGTQGAIRVITYTFTKDTV
jgi:hypothetical protein